jgi:hypothetical protein
MLTVAGHAGVNRIRFRGALGHGKRLALGRYRLTVVATSSAGGSSPRVQATFTLVN